MKKRTHLYELHRQAGAYLVDFAGWEMPLHYGSQVQEHHYVRQHAGIFDVSHMGIVNIEGQDATDFLRYVLANDVQKLHEIGDALYTCMLNKQGGIIDDLIVYYLGNHYYRLVINASRREADIAWLQKMSHDWQVTITLQTQLCMLAVQGPSALSIAHKIFGGTLGNEMMALQPFKSIVENDKLIARTGYTGEEGIEIIASADETIRLWKLFLKHGVKPCGLGARDTLRLEAGLNLYGADMTENTSPLESNLSWTVSWEDPKRNFVGKEALLKQKKNGIKEKLIGLIMEQPGVLRNHQRVLIEKNGEGEITSGSFSPTLGRAIALARVPVLIGKTAKVERRGQWIPVKVINPPFINHNKKGKKS